MRADGPGAASGRRVPPQTGERPQRMARFGAGDRHQELRGEPCVQAGLGADDAPPKQVGVAAFLRRVHWEQFAPA